MRQPLIMRAATIPEYRYKGGDGIDHVVRQKNLLLSLYPGATGMKTGFTEKAGRSLIATATRNGRTMLAVVIDAVDIYASAGWLMDKGFATPVSAQQGLDHLPDVVEGASIEQPEIEPAPASLPVEDPVEQQFVAADRDGTGTARNVAILLIGGLPAAVILRRRQVVARRERARLARLAARQQVPRPERPLERVSR
jgi:D-alanyl-D-alanine carboxypeptidase